MARGDKAAPGEFPWQVYLGRGNGGRQICSGTLISAEHVLTSAKCAKSVPASKMRVTFGTISYTRSAQKKRSVADIMVHPDYNSGTKDYDFAIVKLASPVPLENNHLVKM